MDKRYEALDGLRGVAAIAVLAHHVGVVGHRDLMTGGYLAVDFFFLLSGFVIALAYERAFAEGLGRLAYVRLRLERLYPMILVGAALGVAAAFLSQMTSDMWIGLAAQLAFIPFATTQATAFPLNNPQWSLLFELVANVAHVLIWPGLTTRRLVLLVLVLGAALFGVLAVNHNLRVGWGWDNFWGGFPRVSFSFFLGVLIFRLRNRLPRIAASYPLLLLVFAATLAVPHIALTASDTVRDGLAVFIFFPAILVAALSAKLTPGWRRLAAFGGAVSFPVYAIHYPLLQVAKLSDYSQGPYWMWFWIAVAAFIVAAAWTLERLYERPVLGLLRAARKRRATKAGPVRPRSAGPTGGPQVGR